HFFESWIAGETAGRDCAAAVHRSHHARWLTAAGAGDVCRRGESADRSADLLRDITEHVNAGIFNEVVRDVCQLAEVVGRQHHRSEYRIAPGEARCL